MRAVLILWSITEKSVEEAMYQAACYKLDIDNKVNKSMHEEQRFLGAPPF